VVYDFCESRAGEHARAFLGDWKGSLICDDYAGYKQSIAGGVTEVGCLAHARRKFFDLHVATRARLPKAPCNRLARSTRSSVNSRISTPTSDKRIRQLRSAPVMDALHRWMLLTRQKITDGSATAKALDYSLKRWGALTRFVDDGRLPVDNNWIENQIRPDCHRALKLAVRRIAAGGQTRRRSDESDSVGAHERARSVCLPEGHPQPAANAQGQPHRGTAAASLAEGSASPPIHRESAN
jgi:hypothetical protein